MGKLWLGGGGNSVGKELKRPQMDLENMVSRQEKEERTNRNEILSDDLNRCFSLLDRFF